MTPKIGSTVLFYLNDDLVPSPAMVINTHATTNKELLAELEPIFALDVRFDWGEPPLNVDFYVVEETVEGIPVARRKERHRLLAPTPGNADLLVHGLLRDYRVYDAPQSAEPRAAHWVEPW